MEVKCEYCNSDIDDLAALCRHCGKWKNKIKNNLLLVAQVSGLTAVIAASVTFIAAHWGELFPERDVVFYKFLSGDKLVAYNSGNTDAYLASVYFAENRENPPSVSQNIGIHKLIQPGEMLEYRMKKHCPNSQSYIIANSVHLEGAEHRSIYSALESEYGCVEMHVALPNDDELRHYKTAFGDNLLLGDTFVELEYMQPHGGETYRETLDAVVFYAIPDPDPEPGQVR